MTNDPIQAWLNAAGRFPLLPKSEMIRLAKKRDTLEPGSRAYTKVINKICEHNLRLVPNVVRKYVNKRMGFTMNSEVISDLLQQGYIGLRRAAEKYDATRGFTFSTYAHPWIYQAFTRWHNSHDRAVYVPEGTMTEVLYRKRHGKPSKSKGRTVSEECINAAHRCSSVASIDVRLDDEDGSTLADLMGNDNSLYYEKQGEGIKASVELDRLMDECGIKPRIQEIVRNYTKRGRMSIVASKLSLSPKHCQNLYQEAVRTMRYKVANG